MRQAGRSLPRYHALKGSRDLLEVTRDPRLAADITKLPLEYFPVDAAVLYADISTIFVGAGIDVRIERGLGPVLPHPYDSRDRIRSLRPFDPRETLGFVMETIDLLRDEIDVPVLGFIGAPFTLMTYMVESPRSKERQGTKAFMWREPALWNDLMAYWADHLTAFARAQSEAGAACIQLFDSWAGVLGPDDYRRYVFPHSARILSELREAGIPTIHFATGNPALLPHIAEAGGDAVGLDWRVALDDGWARVGHERAVQGNLDPSALLAGRDVAIAHADAVLRAAAGRPGHIFNVGHGLLPETDPDIVRAVVEHVHATDPARPGVDAPTRRSSNPVATP